IPGGENFKLRSIWGYSVLRKVENAPNETEVAMEKLINISDYILRKVWKLVIKAGLHIVSSRLSDIVAWLVPLSLKNSIESIVSGLVIAAASYYIWQERNNRLFSNDSRQEEHVCDAIMETVRLKMMSIHFKKTPKVVEILLKWKITSNVT
ncbi:hypothetical protein Tco_0734603, partial [Tanacetum coccineum]